MIATVNGVVLGVYESSLIVGVGGVGLDIRVTSAVINHPAIVGEAISLWTHLVVKEDELSLYGFNSEEEKAIFQLVMSVSGIGPRIAMSVINTLNPEMLANAIQQDEPDVIARVPGLGKKTAQKLILELKGKLLPENMPAGLAVFASADTDVIDALTAIGFSIVEAQAALQSIPRDAPDDLEERIRLALGYFSD